MKIYALSYISQSNELLDHQWKERKDLDKIEHDNTEY